MQIVCGLIVGIYESIEVTTLEELSIFCHWVEHGLPVEHCKYVTDLR